MKKNRQFIIAAALLAVVTAGAYWRALGGGFVFDDKQYILGNPHVQNGLNWPDIRWAFTSWYASNWHPLTWISHMLDSQLWQLNPFGHHLMNLLLHIANTLLLFYVLRRMTMPRLWEASPDGDGASRSGEPSHNLSRRLETTPTWKCAFVAALFALHPLHVESVAWISERKDVLSTLFWLLTMLAYIRYTECPGIKRYLPVFVLLALGLMCKPMLVTLPFVLLLMDYWPLGRVGASRTALIWEKIPLLILSAGSCVVTYLAQQASGSVAVSEFPLSVRVANAAVSSIAYLWKMIVPVRLAAFYPHPGITLPVWQVIGSVLLLAGITALVVLHARKRPYLAAGWLWYIVTLVPVIGLLQVGGQAMADRYTYVPLIGVCIALTWALGQVRPIGRVGASFAVIIVLACAVGTWSQTGHWKDEITLCRRTLAVTRGNAMMHNNLGVALYEQGDLDAAIAEYRKGLSISSTYADLHANYANALSDKGELDQAIAEYKKAIKINPGNPLIYNNLGTALGQQNKVDEAIEACRKAIELQSDLAAPHGNLARALVATGQLDDAVAEYRTALDLEPNDARMHLNLGEALMALGSTDEAMNEFNQALWIRPDFPDAHLNLGVMMINQGKPDEAIEHYRQALKSRPEYAEAHHNLAIALYSKGDYAGAWKEIALCRKYGLTPHPAFLEELGKAMAEP